MFGFKAGGEELNTEADEIFRGTMDGFARGHLERKGVAAVVQGLGAFGRASRFPAEEQQLQRRDIKAIFKSWI